MRLIDIKRKLHVLWIKFIYRNSEWKKYTPYQKELFNEIGIGDIVDCWMPMEPEKLARVKEGHAHRPYYVVQKTDHSLICFYGTSQSEVKKDPSRQLITKDMYNVWKDGYLCIGRRTEIPIDCLIRKLDTLNAETMKVVNRKITAMKNSGAYHGPMYPVPVIFKKGDVIRQGEQYYYVYSAEQKIEAYLLKIKFKNPSSIVINERILDVHHRYIFDSSDDLELVYFCNCNQNAQADFYLRSYKKPKNNVQTLENGHYYKYEVGQYFQEKWTGEKIVYLFSRKGNDYGVYESDCHHRNMKVYRLSQAEIEQTSEYADDNTVTYVLNRLIDSDYKQWGWLEELMTYGSVQ